MKRRLLIAAATALPILASWPWRTLAQQARRVPTPRQTEGPFYPSQFPPEVDSDLMAIGGRAYAKGEPLTVRGTVESLDGKPLAGAIVEVWQCDHDGHYHHPGDGGRADPAFQGYGRTTTDATGRYEFRAMRPVAYPGRTPHLHVKVRQGTRTLLTTQMYVAGEPLNQRDGVLASITDPAQRAAVVIALSPEAGGGWRAEFQLVIDARA